MNETAFLLIPSSSKLAETLEAALNEVG